MAKQNKQISNLLVQQKIDNGFKVLYSLVEFYYESAFNRMNYEEKMAAQDAFAGLKEVFDNHDIYISSDVVTIWQNNLIKYALDKNVSCDQAAQEVISPAEELFGVISPCIKDKYVKDNLHMFLTLVFFWEFLRDKPKKTFGKQRSQTIKQIFDRVDEFSMVLQRLSEYCVRQISLQYTFFNNMQQQ